MLSVFFFTRRESRAEQRATLQRQEVKERRTAGIDRPRSTSLAALKTRLLEVMCSRHRDDCVFSHF